MYQGTTSYGSQHNRSPICARLLTMAERELGAFVSAVAELFGPEQARLAAEDWLEELMLMEELPGSTSHDWRRITVAVSARLAVRVNASSPPAKRDSRQSNNEGHVSCTEITG